MRRIKLEELGAIHWLPCTFVYNRFDQVLQILDPCDAFRVHVRIKYLNKLRRDAAKEKRDARRNRRKAMEYL